MAITRVKPGMKRIYDMQPVDLHGKRIRSANPWILFTLPIRIIYSNFASTFKSLKSDSAAWDFLTGLLKRLL
jgi:hypothetical protein